MSILSKIIFTDVVQRENAEIDRLNYIKRRLEDLQTDQLSGRTITLSESDKRQLQEVSDILKEIDSGGPKNHNKPNEVCDPLFVAVRTLLNEEANIDPELRSHDDGLLIFQGELSAKSVARSEAGDEKKVESRPGDVPLVGLTLGLLALDASTPPAVQVVKQQSNRTGAKASGERPWGNTLYPKVSDPQYQPFTKDFFAALGEARSYGDLAKKVLVILAREGDPDFAGRDAPKVSSLEFAKVMRSLAESKVPVDYPQLGRKVTEALNQAQGVGTDDLGDLEIPNLDGFTDQNIVSANISSVGTHIVSTMLDEVKLFQVVDCIVEQYQQGTLPIGPYNAGKMLYRYWRDAPNRMSEQERRNFAAITLGTTGGEPGAMVNRDFNDLWIRFVSSVSNYIRQNEVDQLLRARSPVSVNQQQVRKAARDLANNLSLHGYGMVHFAARELKQQIKTIVTLLSDQEILGAFGARDMWQVVDQVATYYLSGAKTSSRYRTLATCGQIITSWLANNVARIVSPTQPIIRFNEVRFPNDADGHNPRTNPNDYDLVNACELWLADTATTDSQVEELSQPREAPMMTSKPIPIPAMAKEMLDGIGDIGMGLGSGARVH